MQEEAQQRYNNRHNKVKKGSFTRNNRGTINSNFDAKAGTITGTINQNQGSFTRHNRGTINFKF